MGKHLAIFEKDFIQAIFSGTKSVESRFSINRIAPFGQVQVGDIVYMKPPGEDIVGQFSVSKVVSIQGLDKGGWDLIKQFNSLLGFPSKEKEHIFYEKHKDAQFVTLVYISNVEQFITSPLKIVKKDKRGWMVLDKV